LWILNDLADKIKHCTKCSLHQSRNHPIVGEGNIHAEVMLIGEAPGADEDRVGRPFIGKSGQLLDKIMEACGFTREEHIYISNIIRCRPPNNRVPTDTEVLSCLPYLMEQIQIIDPKMIIALGSTALKQLMCDNSLKITRLRGKWIDWENRLLMPVYHPAALLRNPSLKRETWEDFKKVVHTYRELVNPDHYSKHV
jgi:uracil-DNA glycosylase family 4